MAKNLNTYPYYSDDERAKDRGFKQILYVPGRSPQARELTQQQSLINQQRQINFDTIYKNGTVVEGIELSVVTVDSVTTANISSGRFYYEGRIFETNEDSIVIDGTGSENLGLFVDEEIVTAAEDPTLVDPAQGYPNYGLQGADRLKITVQLVKLIPNGTPGENEKLETADGVTRIWILIDGVLQEYVKRPQYSVLGDVMAKRTYDESGHYLVEGMKLTTEPGSVPEGEDPDTYDNPNLQVAISPGLAYVYGYDNTLIVPRKIDVPRALTYTPKLNEPHEYDENETDYTLFEPYVVIDATVASVIITAEVEVPNMQIERGTGDYDEFTDAIYGGTYSSIASIVEIPGYTVDVDYKLENDQVKWLSGGSRPSLGSTYYITFIYYKNAERGATKDFIVVEDSEEADIYLIRWTGVGDVPVDGTNFLVDYSHYLARTDLFSLDKFGKIIRTAGIPTEYDVIEIPPFNPELLPLGWIKFQAGKDYDDVFIHEYNFKRTTMFELHYLKERVDNLEENLAAVALEGEVKEGELSTTLKGIYVDPLNSLFKVDAANNDFYATINLIDEECTMVSLEHEHELDESSAARVNIETYKDIDDEDFLHTLDKTADEEYFSITQKSGTINCNPYGIVKKKAAGDIRPRKDHWIDRDVTERTLVNNRWKTTQINRKNLKWSRNSRGETVQKSKFNIDEDKSFTTKQQIKERTDLVGEKVEQSKVIIDERLITTARQRTIKCGGRNFTPAAYVACTFGGTQVKLLATSPYRNETSGGQATGRIIIGSDGSWKGSFIVPPNIKSGNIEVRFVDNSSVGNEVIIVYSSKGILRSIENRTTITRTRQKTIDIFRWKEPNPPREEKIIPPQPPTNPPVPTPIRRPDLEPGAEEGPKPDPIAQSFVFQDDLILTAFDVFFATKADQNPKPVLEDELYNFNSFQPTDPVLIKIGYMVNDYPDGNNIIHQQELYPEDITTSLYGQTPTRITLKEPIFIPALKGFYISLGSKSTEYSVFVATLGQKDLETQQIISSNPYLEGVLFTSSNALTWSAGQDKDLAITLYRGNFATSGSITYPAISFPLAAHGDSPAFSGFGRFNFLTDFFETPNSRIIYYYTTDGGTTWKPFNPAEELDLESPNDSLQIKVEMTGDGIATPFADFHTNLLFYRYDISQTNEYLTKGVQEVPSYNNMKLILDENISTGTNLLKEFSFDGLNWLRFLQTTPDETINIGGGFFRNSYIMKFNRIERLSIVNKAGGDFTIGDSLTQSGTGATGDVIGFDLTQDTLWIIHDSDEFVQFGAAGQQISNGTGVTADVNAVYRYDSEPKYPTYFKGRVYLESTAYYRTPIMRNIRWVMRIVF
jgi:hypothetical protein